MVKERFGEETEAVTKAFAEAYPELDPSYAAAVDHEIRPAVLDFFQPQNEGGGSAGL